MILFILKNLLNLLKKVSNKFVVVHLPSLVSVIIKLEQTKDFLIFVCGHELICSTEKYNNLFLSFPFMKIAWVAVFRFLGPFGFFCHVHKSNLKPLYLKLLLIAIT